MIPWILSKLFWYHVSGWIRTIMWLLSRTFILVFCALSASVMFSFMDTSWLSTCQISSLPYIQAYFVLFYNMMTSSNGNIFRVTGHLCGEFTGPGEFSAQRPVTRTFDVFFDLRLNKPLSKHCRGCWFETLSRPLWRHCNEICWSFIRCFNIGVALMVSHRWFTVDGSYCKCHYHDYSALKHGRDRIKANGDKTEQN